jgi:hypothetical protein
VLWACEPLGNQKVSRAQASIPEQDKYLEDSHIRNFFLRFFFACFECRTGISDPDSQLQALISP